MTGPQPAGRGPHREKNRGRPGHETPVAIPRVGRENGQVSSLRPGLMSNPVS
jgi:hypothetical protein